MSDSKALELADTAHLGYRIEWQCQAQEELRRQHAQIEALEKQLEAVRKDAPVAWGLFAKVEDGSWNLQHPIRFSEEDAEADRAMYEEGTLLDVRPLYTRSTT